MRIGRIQIYVFNNFTLGTKPRKRVNRFYINISLRLRRISINLFGKCLSISMQRRFEYDKSPVLSGKEFASLMKSRGVDLSKSKMDFVEISANGVKKLP